MRKKLIKWLPTHKWHITAVIWIVALTLGYIGYSKYYSDAGESVQTTEIVYRTLQLIKLGFYKLPVQTNIYLDIARFLAPAMTIYTILQALVSIFQSPLHALRMRFIRNHVIICGVGRKGVLLSDHYRELGERVIVIDKNASNVMIEHCKERGALVLIGDATDRQLLNKARVHKAKCIVSVCSDDGVNTEVCMYSRQLAQARKGKPLSCLVHIVDLLLWSILREREIRMGRFDRFRIGFFNIYESGSRILLYKYTPFDNYQNKERPPRIIVIGLGRLGQSLVVNAAKKWMYSRKENNERLVITVIDREAQKKVESLHSRCPDLREVCDLIPLAIDIDSSTFNQAKFLFNDNGHCDVNMVYICFGNDSVALTSAIKLYDKTRHLNIPIIVRMDSNTGLTTLLHSEECRQDNLENVHAFSLLEQTCTPELICDNCTNEILAHAIHEDYLLNCAKRGETSETNPSMVPWNNLPETLKESNRSQAEHIMAKLQRFGYDLMVTTDWNPPLIEFSQEEIENMAIMEHKRFVDERLRDGWKYGPSKDIERKLNPTLVPWNELSEVEKDKDRNTVKGIPAFLSRAGYQVHRLKKSGS